MTIDRSARPPWTPQIVATEPSPRDISMLASPSAMNEIFGRPSTSTPSRRKSRSASFFTRSNGTSARSQYPSMTGRTSSCTNSRTASWWARSSGVTSAKAPT